MCSSDLAVWGNAFPDEVLFHDEGNISSHKKIHNLYGFLMARSCHEGLQQLRPNERPFVITRAGFSGVQRYSAVWTGDNQSTEEHLSMGIRMLQTLGICGIPFVGTDVGGFGGSPSGELYVRWLQSALFAPFLRTHTHYGSNSQEPWSYGEEIEEICRQTITRRYEVIPLLYSLFWEHYRTGAPILRPMFWHDQSDPNVYDTAFQEQFFVGESLLVAPVTQVGHYLKKVYLPRGKWLDMNTEKVHEGGNAIILDAPLSQLPHFLKEGGMIPSRAATQFVEEKKLTDLFLDVFPGQEESQFVFYEDDGKSMDYTQGIYRLTRFICKRENGKLSLQRKCSYGSYRPGPRTLTVRFHAVSLPERDYRVLATGHPMPSIPSDEDKTGFHYDSGKRILTVRIPEEPGDQTIVVEER